jgi:hypothetical protein
MKIGVFDNSFADSQTSKDIWWRHLANDYQHTGDPTELFKNIFTKQS